MITIIPATQFTITPWKNGKGQTTELAINHGGTLDNFDWRISMANVVEDGVFSNFSGYTRNLVLIEGNGLTLTHDVIHTDRLTNLLDFATFDGSSTTQAEIINGGIKDFNIITAKNVCHAQVSTFVGKKEIPINHQGLVFAFSLSDKISVLSDNTTHQIVPSGDLLQLSSPSNIVVAGQDIILVKLVMMVNS